MAPRQRAFTGLLLKPIDLEEARPNSLAAALALAPDEEDIRRHVKNEVAARWNAFDGVFGLDSDRKDIWECRAKALICHKLNISLQNSRCWEIIARRIAGRHLRGFSIKKIGKRRGAPLEWSPQRLAELFADVEYLKRERKISIRAACRVLATSRRYRTRWGGYGGKFRFKCIETLAKAYHKAKTQLRDWRFKIMVCGPEVLIPAKDIDPIEAAIRLHALHK